LLDLKTHTLTTAPAPSQPLLRGLHEAVGFVPNLAARMSESPTLLEAFLELREVNAKGTLDAVTRELIAIAAATETGCTYCVAAHSTFALKLGGSEAAVAAARGGGDADDARLAAILRFVRSLVQRRADVPDRARDVLAAGLALPSLLDVLVAVAVPMLATSVHQLGAVPLDAAFEPQAWKRSA
jgi:AhpD family alkylhydroperoxidase